MDDEDLILQTIGAALQAIGLEVTTARDGLEALDSLGSLVVRALESLGELAGAVGEF